MRIGTVLRDLHHDGFELARTLVRAGRDHRADHEESSTQALVI
jgi:hypothetical protein